MEDNRNVNLTDLINILEYLYSFAPRYREIKSEEFYRGYMKGVQRFFQELKLFVPEDFTPREPSKDEAEEFEDPDFPLIGILEYRYQPVPVYLDENGQCLFIKYGNHTMSGGSFNSFPYMDFSDMIDSVLDEEE